MRGNDPHWVFYAHSNYGSEQGAEGMIQKMGIRHNEVRLGPELLARTKPFVSTLA